MSEPTQQPLDASKDLTRKAVELEILQRVSWEINSTLDLDEIYDIALQTMSKLFDFHHAIILLLEGDGETLTVVASRGYENQAVGGQVKVGTGVIGVVAKKRKMMHVDNLGQMRSYVSAQRREMQKAGRAGEIGATVPVPGLPSAESQIALPLLVRDTLIGVFSIESPARRTFDEHSRALVTIVANQIASAIHNARLFATIRQSNEMLEERVRQRTADLERELRVARELLDDARKRVEGPLLGTSAAVLALRAGIRRHAGTDETLLLTGPPGAGREATARAIHHESKRRDGAFIQVNCPQVRDPAALFGTGSNAEPGAGQRPDETTLSPRPVAATTPDTVPATGKLLLAAGGTLYLDAVHELPMELQTRLAVRLEGMQEARARGATPDPDVRVIASTARDLAAEAREGRVEPRLGRLLLHTQLAVPPLATRREDIPALVEHFLQRQAKQLGKTVESISPRALERLQSYSWPGNIRELRTVIERAILVAQQPVLEIDEELLDGSVSLGSYRLVQRLGSGGMGEVWLGKHQLLARPAAIKLIRTEISGGPEHSQLLQRFRREAQVTANLRSAHTVELYDFGISESGAFYYVMQYLVGMDLKALVERFGPLPPERVVMLLSQACLSLSEAHEHGLVHRDIKPANLFVTKLGPEYDYVKVLDFGMVKGAGGDEARQLTAQGVVHGTPAFIAPELVLDADVDGRADLYSLGCAAHWLLTGLPVFEPKNPTALLIAHVQTPPRPPSAVAEQPIPPELDALVLRCLEKSPQRRPATAMDLWEELQRIPGAKPWTQERARRWWQQHAPESLV